MGTVLSGNRGWRGGRRFAEGLPVVKLLNAELYSVKAKTGPILRLEDHNQATVHYGLRSWAVYIESAPLRLGGHRRWLGCPECNCRRVALYVVEDRLACRVCARLRHQSQNDNARYRLIRRADKIRARLGWPPGVLMPKGVRPARMHKGTYQRLVAKHDQIVGVLVPDLAGWVERLEALRGDSSE